MQPIFLPIIALFLLHSPIIISTSASISGHHGRRILHQPLFPLHATPPTHPPTSSPKPKPKPKPKPNNTRHALPPPPSAHPLSSTPAGSSTTTNANPANPFFPTSPSLSPPPPAASSSSGGSGGYTAIPTFPANISSLVVPHSRSSSSHSSKSQKLIATTVVLCVIAASLIVSFAYLRHRHRHRRNHQRFKAPPQLPEQTPHSEHVLLYPPYSATSDGRPPKLLPRPGVSSTSSEFLYLGTLACSNSREFEPNHETHFDSPEIRPLPPLPALPRQNLLRNSDSDGTGDDEEQFYSPTGSSGRIESFSKWSSRRALQTLGRVEGFQIGTKLSNIASYPASPSTSPGNSARSEPSVLLNSASGSSKSYSPENTLRPPQVTHRAPPPPPPPPPPPATGRGALTEPPVLPQPSRSIVGFKSCEQQAQPQPQALNHDKNEGNNEFGKPKLKGLHWDKVRASSDSAMVWDQLEPGSFALNEEMIETLFTAKTSSMGAKDLARKPMVNQEYRVLNPKKSQNIAILLRVLNVTVEEVCDSLLEGNADMLGTELLESLLKMAPTEEEEHKLREFEDESPLKLGPAEKFLKAVLDVPFAFKRVDAMLYIANFDSEVEYLRRSFDTLEVACEELRSSRMFLKLLEAVLKTGNRMNVGTNRGDAQAFKLDTLLKLVDVKGTDGKTTLLHFVVQEIIKAESPRVSHPEAENSQAACSGLHDGMETRKRGLQVVASLCGELKNVKKAAAMDSDALASDVRRLVRGIAKVEEAAMLNEEIRSLHESYCTRFADSMNEFLKRAGKETSMILAEESASLSKVKELTEYFHGNSAMEEAHPFRIFMVVRDFLSILDRECKEVAKVTDRTTISSNRQFPVPVNPTLHLSFPNRNDSSSS